MIKRPRRLLYSCRSRLVAGRLPVAVGVFAHREGTRGNVNDDYTHSNSYAPGRLEPWHTVWMRSKSIWAMLGGRPQLTKKRGLVVGTHFEWDEGAVPRERLPGDPRAGGGVMLSSREWVGQALTHQESDRISVDLGASPVTGMHVCTGYSLRQTLKLDESDGRTRRPAGGARR